MKKPVRVGATLALALCLATPFRTVSADILEQVLVKVNGDIITKTDLETRQIAAIRGRINSQVDADALKNDAQLKQMLAEVTPRILVDAIDELLMIQLGKEKGYRATDQQFKDWVADIRKNQGLDDEQKFQAALKQEGMTMEELRRNFERQVVIYRVQQDEVGPKLQITEEEARQYYLSHQQEFVTPSQVTLREILIEVPAATQGGQRGINVGQEDDAKQKATAVRARLSAGEDFVKVASEVSTAASKANGGLIGRSTPRSCRRTCSSSSNHEARRDHPAAARRKGLPDPQARDEDDADSQALRERSRSGSRKSLCRAPAWRGSQVPRPAAQPGVDRLEERGPEESLRTGPQARRGAGRAQLSSRATERARILLPTFFSLQR